MDRQTMLEKIDKHILDEMNERFFVLIEAENGGFESAADRFVMSILG
jgi:hypothetical protein